jgi:hypothetical protein
MRNQDPNRDRPRRPQSEWDWDYYSKYGYTPYSPYLRNNYYGRYYYGPEYAHETPYDDRQYGRQDRRSRGPYSGYGPSSYSRSDDKIREDVNDRLTSDDRIDASDIEVTVTAGTVVLDGSVDSRRDKRVAEDIADSVSGVWDVHNHLRIRNRGYYRGRRAGAQHGQLHEGMEVVASNGDHVGTVQEVRDADFLLNRTNGQDYYVPLGNCHIENDRVKLDAASSELDSRGWMHARQQR